MPCDVELYHLCLSTATLVLPQGLKGLGLWHGPRYMVWLLLAAAMGAGAWAVPLSAQEPCSRQPPQLQREMGSSPWSGCPDPVCCGLPRCIRRPPALRARLWQQRHESQRAAAQEGRLVRCPSSHLPGLSPCHRCPPRGPAAPSPLSCGAERIPVGSRPRCPRRPGRQEEEQEEARSPPPPAAERPRR